MPSPRNRRRAATVGYLALAAVDTYLAGRPELAARRVRHVTKPMLMPMLATSTHLARAGRGDHLLRGVQVAQAFSWGGDLALLGSGKKSFLTGIGSFLVAHLGYIAGFASARDPEAGVDRPGPKAAAATWVTMAPVMARAAGRQDPSLRVPVAVYAAVLTTMFATSTTLHRSLPSEARTKIVAGTSLFLLSDTILAVQKFLRSEHSAVLESAVMATYTTGQWLIAEGAVAAT
ncbi:MAG TPA: lysoplasmalogenase [Nocardioidaceae bacterium]